MRTAAANKKKNRTWRGWISHLLSSVLIIAFIKWATFDIYTIPTPSMEGSLLVGDFLFVSKLSYGPRTPKTLLQIPLTNGVIWHTRLPAYLDWIQLPMFRFPGFQKVKRNHVVVFNYPPDSRKPLDVRPYYVKRCIGVGGDTIAIRKATVFINGTPADVPKHVQYRYYVHCERRLPQRVFQTLGIWDVSATAHGYIIHASPEQAARLRQKPFILEVNKIYTDPLAVSSHIFPKGAHVAWTPDHYGPILIPYKGMSFVVNDSTWAHYGETVTRHEGYKKVFFDGNNLFLNDKKYPARYVFRKNYYFMMGDNRDNSEDSRYWGFVPDDHIVGKPVMVAVSFDKQAPFFLRLRWRRMFHLIN